MKRGIFLLAVSLFLIGEVFAFGVSIDPSPLKIIPGATAEIPLNIQNMIGDSPIKITMQWIEGEEIAQIAGGTTYTLQPKTEVNLKIKVSIPKNAKIGDSYNIKLKVSPAPAGEGQIEVTTAYLVEKPILVVSEAPQSPSPQEQPAATQPAAAEIPTESPKQNKTLIAVIAVILIALVVLVIVLMRKKK